MGRYHGVAFLTGEAICVQAALAKGPEGARSFIDRKCIELADVGYLEQHGTVGERELERLLGTRPPTARP